MSVIPGLPQSNQTSLEEIGLTSAKSKTQEANSTTDFLQLFVAQLQNQNPLEPQEGSEFLSQLAQFSTVEGIQNLDNSFSKMANTLQSSAALQASSMVGRKVEVPSNTVLLENGKPVQGSIDVPNSVTDLTLEVVDSQGLVVKTMNLGTAQKGQFQFNWNGLDDNDTPLEQGNYRINAKATVDGEQTNFTTLTRANVDSVTIDSNGQGLVLNVAGHGPVSINDVKTIS